MLANLPEYSYPPSPLLPLPYDSLLLCDLHVGITLRRKLYLEILALFCS